MLTPDLYDFLARLLETRPVLFPRAIQLDFPDGYQPIHLKCYRTARKVQQLTGQPVIAGVAFLDKGGKLFPWPHMVNAAGFTLADGLVDASPRVNEPDLGFVPILATETVGWNAVTSAYGRFTPEASAGPLWGDRLADTLSQTYLPRLRFAAAFARRPAASLAIPEHMRDLSD